MKPLLGGCLSIVAGLGLGGGRHAVPQGAAELPAALRSFLGDPLLRHARVGFRLEEPGRPAPLLDHDGSKGFLPASNMKLVTSAAALLALGPDFRFRTRFEGRGEQRGPTFEGDLVVVGAGDPTFGAPAFEPLGGVAPFYRLAAALRASGVRRIAGRVLGDDDCQPDEIMGRGWDWSYHAEAYAAQVSGLCFHENCVDLLLGVDDHDGSLELRLDPPTRYLTVESLVRRLAPGEAARTGITASRALGLNHVVLRGELSAGGPERRERTSVDNPTAFAATLCRETLVAAGIEVTGPAGDLDAAGLAADARPRRLLHDHGSAPLSSIVRELNKRSQNLYAEQLVRAVGRERGGDGSMASGRAAVLRVLRDLGVPEDGLVMADGSGLSRLDLVQPRHLTALLASMLSRPEAEAFRQSLPVAGVDGTLRRRFQSASAARGRVQAKTGYVARVVALSGYVPRRDRPPLVFSLLVNDFLGEPAPVQALVDTLVDRIAALAGPLP